MKRQNAIFLQSKAIVRWRTQDYLQWTTIGQLLRQNDPDNLGGEDPQGLGRTAKSIFNKLCLGGYAEAPPVGTIFVATFKSPTAKVPVTPDFSQRLARLVDGKKIATAQGKDDLELDVYNQEIRSLRDRFKRYTHQAEERVLRGRPLANEAEAKNFHKPVRVWNRVTMEEEELWPPLVSDRALLGPERYQELIDQRVAKVKQNPYATDLDLTYAKNPELTPLPVGMVQRHTERKNSTHRFWPLDSPERLGIILGATAAYFEFDDARKRSERTLKRNAIIQEAIIAGGTYTDPDAYGFRPLHRAVKSRVENRFRFYDKAQRRAEFETLIEPLKKAPTDHLPPEQVVATYVRVAIELYKSDLKPAL